MDLSALLSSMKGVGPKTAEQFAAAGLYTVRDLIYFFPRAYEDFSKMTTIAAIRPGNVTLRGHFEDIHTRRVRRSMTVTEATLVDATGKVAVVWFNQSYRVQQISTNKEFLVSGEFCLQRNKYQLTNPAVEQITDSELANPLPVKGQAFSREGENKYVSVGRIVPVYRQVAGLKTQLVRKIIVELKPYILALDETLPVEIVAREKLMSHADAVYALHFPGEAAEPERAKERLGYEELLALVTASLMNRADNDALESHQIVFDAKDAQDFVGRLPFSLTNSQRVAAWEAIQNLSADKPMNRLLQGDVGAGKTVVAGLIAYIASRAGFQTAFMAPTELLANQHAETLQALLAPFEVSVALLTGSVKGKARKTLYENIANGTVEVVVGTHALIQDTVQFHNLGFVVIDEQHRFGVEQRQKLLAKANAAGNGRAPRRPIMPHLLAMTATPIPRSLQLTIYGELDISKLNEKPKNRLPIKTEIISPNSRAQMYEKVEREIEAGHQVYVICPLISNGTPASYAHRFPIARGNGVNPIAPAALPLSTKRVTRKGAAPTEARSERDEDGANFAAGPATSDLRSNAYDGSGFYELEQKSVEAEIKRLRQGPFRHRQIGLLHGKLAPADKQAAMLEFASGKTDILVSTTVVEVGVDVPNATVIIIEGADTFGLAQLHQLRGRVGRSELQSYCYLVPSTSQRPSWRLRELEKSNDGFYLAEKDLELRGPGEIYGRAQHGDLNLQMANIGDTRLTKRVRTAAEWLIAHQAKLVDYPALTEEISRYRRLTTLN